MQQYEVEYLQFAFRWMNNLLMRELPLRCTIRLWDTYQVQIDTHAAKATVIVPFCNSSISIYLALHGVSDLGYSLKMTSMIASEVGAFVIPTNPDGMMQHDTDILFERRCLIMAAFSMVA